MQELYGKQHIKNMELIVMDEHDTEATSSSIANITPLDLESQMDENTTPVNTLKMIATSPDGSRAKKYWKLESDREARLEEYGKRPEDHWRKLEAIRILEEDHVHEPEPKCDDEDNCY
ncbi:hypothetical protein Tco_0261446 [Tanacetum coccineum]